MKRALQKKPTLLQPRDSFLVRSFEHRSLDIFLHYHTEFELNLMEGGQDGLRTMGEQSGIMAKQELVLIAPGLAHGWKSGKGPVRETLLHFDAQLFGAGFLGHTEMRSLKNMLIRAEGGLLFDAEATEKAIPLFQDLKRNNDFGSVLSLLRLLHFLSQSQAIVLAPARPALAAAPDGRMEKVLEWIQVHFAEDLSLKQLAGLARMKEASFSRFFGRHTGRSFVDYLNEVRIAHAARMLVETTHSVSEIAFASGFQNISNFNRNFKTYKNLTPTQYREVFAVEKKYRIA